MIDKRWSQWKIFPHAIFYNTGFPLECLNRLRLTKVTAESHLPMQQEQNPGDDNGRDATARFDSEFAASRAALRDIIAQDEFRNALFTTNANLTPEIIDAYINRWQSDRRRSKDRRFELTMMRYIQRATMKTHVASGLGLVNFVRFDSSSDKYLDIVRRAATEPPENEVFFGMWVAESIADVLSRDPAVQPFLIPRLNAVCELKETKVIARIEDREYILDEAQQSLLPRIGKLTVRELSRETGVSEQKLIDTLWPLIESRFVSIRPVVPSTVFHPFRAVKDFVQALPQDCSARTHYLEQLSGLDELRIRYRHADLTDRVACLQLLEERFVKITGRSPRRAPGEIYADRLLVYEEVRGNIQECVFGAPFVAELSERLQPILDLCCLSGELYLAHIRDMCRRVLNERSTGSVEMPFLDFVSQLQSMGQSDAFSPESAEMRRFEREWTDLVMKCSGGSGVAPLTKDDLYELLSRFDIERLSAHAAVDLMIASESEDDLSRGNYKVVVGEVGENVMIWGSQFYFYPQRELAESQAADIFRTMSGYERLAIILPKRNHKGFINESFAGIFVQAYGETLRTDALKLHDLFVVLENGRARLKTGDGEYLQFFHHHDDLVHLWAFAAPRIFIPSVMAPSHVPRIEIEGTLLQREQWMVPAHLFSSLRGLGAHELYDRAWAHREPYGLPERVFVHVPGEVKPVFIDFQSALSVEVLVQMAPLEGDLRIVEVVPDIDQCWFTDARAHYASEIRLLAYRSC